MSIYQKLDKSRAMLVSGQTQTSIANRYNVSHTCIGRIARGATWKV